MFEVAELGHKLSKEEFKQKAPWLHTQLLQVQRELRESKYSVIILVSGVEGAGKGDVVNRLNEWLDSRGVKTTAFWDETDEQAMRPRYWRFWRAMPPRGSIGVMFGSWYTKPIVDRVYDQIDEAEYERRLQEIVELERMLAADKVVLIKLWYHLTQDKVKKQMKLDAQKKGERLRVDPSTKKYSRQFETFLKVSETVIRTTDKGIAPWHVIEAADAQYRDICTGQIILETLRTALDQDAAAAATNAAAPALESARPADKGGRKGAKAAALQQKKIAAVPAMVNGKALKAPSRADLTVLDTVDLSHTLNEKEYKSSLQKWQAKLQLLSWEARKQKRSVVIVFEGWDAAGKGSTIRRLTQARDARLFQVISIAAPTDEERAQHYLWRFWRHLPMAGYLTIYDRSWYGRVLVERVEKFTAEEDWQRGYTEINLFEQQLSEHGIILLKFWLHLSPQEQLRRFREREGTPWKQHKITAEDWRNRDQWDAYKLAINDMVAHTSTAIAPWHLVPAEDKKFGRIDVLKTVCKALRKAL
jgi:polyphosphate kinase 2 (PPK2 family)